MKCKIFASQIGMSLRKNLAKLEQEINEWLVKNPNIKIKYNKYENPGGISSYFILYED